MTAEEAADLASETFLIATQTRSGEDRREGLLHHNRGTDLGLLRPRLLQNPWSTGGLYVECGTKTGSRTESALEQPLSHAEVTRKWGAEEFMFNHGVSVLHFRPISKLNFIFRENLKKRFGQ